MHAYYTSDACANMYQTCANMLQICIYACIIHVLFMCKHVPNMHICMHNTSIMHVQTCTKYAYMHVLFMYYSCIMHVLCMYYACIIHVLFMYYSCIYACIMHSLHMVNNAYMHVLCKNYAWKMNFCNYRVECLKFICWVRYAK